MNTYEEAKRILSELSLENINLRHQVESLKERVDHAGPASKSSNGVKDESDCGDEKIRNILEEDLSWEVQVRKFVTQTVKKFPSLLHFLAIVCICYVWGRWSLPFWLVLMLAIPWLEIIRTSESKRLANDIVVKRYLRRLLIVDDDAQTLGDTAAWLNRAMVRLWPSALEPMISQSVLESVQAMFDEFLNSQSVIRRLKVEAISLGSVPLRIKRVRTGLPEANVAVTKKKAGIANPITSLFESMSEKQQEDFDILLERFQEASEESRIDIDLDIQFVPSDDMKIEISAGLHKALPFYLHLNNLTLEGTIRIRLSKLMSAPPFIGILGITFPTLPDLDFEIRPVSKLLGDITSMPVINQIGDLVRSSLTVLALPNVLELPLGEWAEANPNEEAAAVRIVKTDDFDEDWENENPQLRLDIEVLRAHNLAAADNNLVLGKSSDPYVEIDCAHNHGRTKVKSRTLNPKWNEHFMFMLHNLEQPVKFSVYDRDRVGKNTFLGSAVVDLATIFDGSNHMVELKLNSVEFGQQGTLMVALELYDLGFDLKSDEDEEDGQEAVAEEETEAPKKSSNDREEPAGKGMPEEKSDKKVEADAGKANADDGEAQDVVGDLPKVLEDSWNGKEEIIPLPRTRTMTKEELARPAEYRRESELLVEDIRAALGQEGESQTSGDAKKEVAASSAPSTPRAPKSLKSLHRTRTKKDSFSHQGSYTGYVQMRGGWMKSSMKERYCVLAKKQLVFFKDITCTKELSTLRITPSMEAIGLGMTATGYPVQIQEANKLVMELFVKSDAERQKLVKTFDMFTKV